MQEWKDALGKLEFSGAALVALAPFAKTGDEQLRFVLVAKDLNDVTGPGVTISRPIPVALKQVEKVKELATQVDPEFLGKVAVYSRTKGFMKDMPSFFVALMAGKAAECLKAHDEAGAKAWSDVLWETFPQVIDNGKMLRNVVQIVRSGVTGRKSFGSAPKRLIRSWFDTHDEAFLFRNSIGNEPSIADVI